MKKILMLTASLLFVASVTACGDKKEGDNVRESITLTTPGDSLCYAFGMGQASEAAAARMHNQDINWDAFEEGFIAGANDVKADASYYMGFMQALQAKKMIEGLKDELGIEGNYAAFATAFVKAFNNDTAMLFSEIEAQRVMQKIIMDAQAAQAREELERGQAFLAQKEAEEGVQKTESGLLYKVITEGNGERFAEGATVKCNYTGTFIDGEVFDSNDGIDFTIGQMIPGFNEAMLLMSPGAKYELYIPSELAYGANPRNGMPANAVLIFDLETIELVK